MRRYRRINKVAKKRLAAACYFCGMEEYAALDVHRIVPGSEGGIYTDFNSCVACANCHRLIHDGSIVIDRKYQNSLGRWVLHYWDDGAEKWR